MKNIVYWLIIIILFGLYFYLLNIGTAKTEYNECLKWQRQNENITGFYLVEWQVNQCDSYNIIIE